MNEIRTEEIRVEISSDGKVKITVSGMKGDTCRDATKHLEELLGVVEERVSDPNPVGGVLGDGIVVVPTPVTPLQ